MKHQEKILFPSTKKNSLQKLYQFKKLPIQNKRCANCGDFGPTFICVNFGTFVCTICAGIHRELLHRVKSIELSEWTNDEIEFILSHGNLKDQCYYLAKLSESEKIYQHHQFDSLKLWIKDKYIHKNLLRWCLPDDSNKKTPQETTMTSQNSGPLIQLDSTAMAKDSPIFKSLVPETPTVFFFDFPDSTPNKVKNIVPLSFRDKKNNNFDKNIKQEANYDQKNSLESGSTSERQQKDTNLCDWATQLHFDIVETKHINTHASVPATSFLLDGDNTLLPTDIPSSVSSTKTLISTMRSQDTCLETQAEYLTTDGFSKNSFNVKQVSPCCDYLFDTLP
ncbi:uncharacterized protein LOC128883346 isoform X2 [Hylaeus volcanicus]|uniref:uncharacterized protein LOC128883346 isoform X2 n=1 Tax=Hylaeus volcanicus TaxID=313075 RepID=UPI0023B79875|nr:uncharacterized protein LOC128883346 isoform X2 [Hylaeus volcanicus]